MFQTYQAQANENNWRLMLSWLTGRHPSGTGRALMAGPLPILLGWLVALRVLYLPSVQSLSLIHISEPTRPY